jgi:hypothetical protein
MLVAPLLLTPLMLAAEPVLIEIPDHTYDHRTQTSTLKGNVANQVRYTFTHSMDVSGRSAGDADGDEDGR